MTESPIIITTGDPAGVGPDLCLDVLLGDCPRAVVVAGDRDVLARRAEMLKVPFNIADYDGGVHHRAVLHCAAAKTEVCGQPSSDNAAHVLAQLDAAIDGCLQGRFLAMTTGPVNKQIINEAGFEFCGQTEYVAARVSAPHPVMLLAGQQMRVALATRHVPLSKVPAALSVDDLSMTLRVLDSGLRQYFTNGRAPYVAVAGLNPHAGEDGAFGDEEARIIRPAIERAIHDGVNVEGPFAADSMFKFVRADCYLAMYHDQGLPVIKYADFDNTVNATLGLPFLRTSPDHGTAADLAGKGVVSPHSMRAAVQLAATASTVS